MTLSKRSPAPAPYEDDGFVAAAIWRLSSIELWERFSYYTLMTLLPLFLTAPIDEGGFAWSQSFTLQFYGFYMAFIQCTPFLGGLFTDRFLGSRRALYAGATLMLFGHALMAGPHLLSIVDLPSEWKSIIAPGTFFVALVLVALGNGLFKPNITVIVGRLPHNGGAGRDAAFGNFWLAIGVGAGIAVLLGGLISERLGWHWAFAGAGIGMGFSMLLMRRYGSRYIDPFATEPTILSTESARENVDWSFLKPLAAVLFFTVLFGTAYFQTNGALTLFTSTEIDRTVFGFEIPTIWLVALNPIFMLLLMPPLARAWRVGKGPAHDWSVSQKISAGFVLLALSFLIMLGGILDARDGPATGMWVVVCVLVLTCAEIMVAPITVSAVSELAPSKVANVAMGAFFAAVGLGAMLSGQLGAAAVNYGYVPAFGAIVLVALCSAWSLWLSGSWFRRHGI